MTAPSAELTAGSRPNVFPGLDREEVLGRVKAAWSLVDGWVVVPTWDVPCPMDVGADGRHPVGDPHLGGYEVQLSRIHYKVRKIPATLRGRADVVFKCCACSRAWTHGVPVPAEIVERATRDHGHTWRWRELLAEVPALRTATADANRNR